RVNGTGGPDPVGLEGVPGQDQVGPQAIVPQPAARRSYRSTQARLRNTHRRLAPWAAARAVRVGGSRPCCPRSRVGGPVGSTRLVPLPLVGPGPTWQRALVTFGPGPLGRALLVATRRQRDSASPCTRFATRSLRSVTCPVSR